MFSEFKTYTTLKILLSEFKQSLSLFFYSGIGLYTLLFLLTLKQKNYYLQFGLEYTFADSLIFCVSKYFVYLFFLPIGLFIRQRVSCNFKDVQLYVRLKNRASIWRVKILSSFIIDFIYCIEIVAIILCISFFLCEKTINWNNLSSIYAMKCGSVNNTANIINVLLIVTGFIYLSLILTDVIIQMISIFSNIFGWMVVILYIGFNMRGNLAQHICNLDYLSFTDLKKFFIVQIFKLGIMLIAFLIGIKVIERKDFYE